MMMHTDDAHTRFMVLLGKKMYLAKTVSRHDGTLIMASRCDARQNRVIPPNSDSTIAFVWVGDL